MYLDTLQNVLKLKQGHISCQSDIIRTSRAERRGDTNSDINWEEEDQGRRKRSCVIL